MKREGADLRALGSWKRRGGRRRLTAHQARKKEKTGKGKIIREKSQFYLLPENRSEVLWGAYFREEEGKSFPEGGGF